MRIIDKAAWPRRGHYDFFALLADPFYSLTFPADVTALREYTRKRGISFYYSLCFLVTKAMERVEAFRYKDRNGTIVLHDRLVPSFTDLAPGSELFHITTLEAGEDMEEFCRRAREASWSQTEFITEGSWAEDEQIYFSCLPWLPLTALTNERGDDPSDSVPRVTWGRYEEKEGRCILSISLKLNHRLVDGIHVGWFYRNLCGLLAGLEEGPPCLAGEPERHG